MFRCLSEKFRVWDFESKAQGLKNKVQVSEFRVREGRLLESAATAGVDSVIWRVSSSLLGSVDLLFRALSGRLKFTVRRDGSRERSRERLSADSASETGVGGL